MPQWDDVMTDNDKKLMGMGFDMRKPTGFGENPALVIIDMNKGAVGEDSPVYEQFDRYPRTCGEYGWRALPYIQRLLAKARETKIPVVYSRHVFRATHGLPRHDDPSFAYSELSPQSEIVDELAPDPGELMIEKTRASVFFSTPLLYVLMNQKVDTLIITGNSTSGCVRATVVDASYYSPAFKVVMAEEAIFDRIELSHKAGLFDMQLKYADLKTTDEIIAYLDQVQAIRAETATA